MSTESSKNNILKKIQAALAQPTPLPFPQSEGTSSVFQPLQQDVVLEFAEQFTQLLGKFNFCINGEELISHFGKLCYQKQWTKIFCIEEQIKNRLHYNSWTDDIAGCEASVTGCEALVARTGSILLSTNNSGRITSVYAPVHICIAYTSQITYDIKDALLQLKEKYGSALPSFISLATGPSRTADIEKTLVVGVHGPKEVYLFLVDDLSEAP